MTDAGGNSRFPAPAAHDQRKREFGDGRPAGRAPLAALSRPRCLVRPATDLLPARRPRSGLRAAIGECLAVRSRRSGARPTQEDRASEEGTIRRTRTGPATAGPALIVALSSPLACNGRSILAPEQDRMGEAWRIQSAGPSD